MKTVVAITMIFWCWIGFSFQKATIDENEEPAIPATYGFLEGPQSSSIDFEDIGTYLRRHASWQRERLRQIWSDHHAGVGIRERGLEIGDSVIEFHGASRPELLEPYHVIQTLGTWLPDPRIRETVRTALMDRGMRLAECVLVFALLAPDNLIDVNLEIGAPIDQTRMRLMIRGIKDTVSVRAFLEERRSHRYTAFTNWVVAFMEILPVHARRVLVSYLDERVAPLTHQSRIDVRAVDADDVARFRRVLEKNARADIPAEQWSKAETEIASRVRRGIDRAEKRAASWQRARQKFEGEVHR